VSEWKKAYASRAEGVEEVDVSPAFSAFFSLKDDAELVGESSLVTRVEC
jgi:hypothetical protein